MQRSFFPVLREEVTAEWMQQALQDSDFLVHGGVTACRLRDVAEQGQTSDTAIVDVSYDVAADNLPSSFLLKFSHPVPAVRQRLSAVSCYEREVNFYRFHASSAGISVPKCYAAHYDPDNFSCVLLLEYIDGARTGNRFDFTLDDVHLAVQNLAVFHANWWNRVDAVPHLLDDNRADLLAMRKLLVSQALSAARKRFTKEVSSAGIDALAWWLDNTDALVAAAALRSRTMIHGDFHLQQMLFPTAGRGRFAVIDWQTVAAGSGADDLSRLIITAMPPAMRKQHEAAFIEVYYAKLLECGVQNYTREDLNREYGLGLLKSLAINSLALIGLDLEAVAAATGRGGADPWYERVFHWPAQAVQEFGVLA